MYVMVGLKWWSVKIMQSTKITFCCHSHMCRYTIICNESNAFKMSYENVCFCLQLILNFVALRMDRVHNFPNPSHSRESDFVKPLFSLSGVHLCKHMFMRYILCWSIPMEPFMLIFGNQHQSHLMPTNSYGYKTFSFIMCESKQ